MSIRFIRLPMCDCPIFNLSLGLPVFIQVFPLNILHVGQEMRQSA